MHDNLTKIVVTYLLKALRIPTMHLKWIYFNNFDYVRVSMEICVLSHKIQTFQKCLIARIGFRQLNYGVSLMHSSENIMLCC